ncbi:MAG: CPBP family intramembrane metalloprotease [Prevotella sp.]|nr:CPBP family intramembrane metalloprotease [Prevotella sp.]
MKGILKSIGFFLLYFLFTMLFQMLLSSVFMGAAAAAGNRDEQLLIEFANNNILGITVISGILTILVFFLIFKLRKADIKKEWKLQKPNSALLILSVIAAFSWSFLFCLLTYENSFENSLMIRGSAEYYSGIFPGLGIIMTVINLIIIAPISEETALRGVVYTRAEKTSPVAAIAVSSLLFGVMHLMAGGVLLVLGGFITGAVLSVIFYKTNSLPACCIAHACANLPDFIFYAHPQITGGLMIFLEIISCAVFVLSTVLLLRKKTAAEN